MRFGLIGAQLGHSFSPRIHALLGGYPYELIELTPDRLGDFLRARAFDGLNVTIPYKQAVLPWLDELTPQAQAIGAVNTIVRRGDRLLGDNTDFGGMAALLGRMGLSIAGQTVLIAGSGGTSRTAAAVAQSLGAGRVLRLSRRPGGDTICYAEAYERYAGAGLLINTTPVGMAPHPEGLPVELDRLPGLRGVADAVYNPLRTRLVLQAQARGIRAEGGLYMLVAQAALAAERFTGEAVPADRVEAVFRRIRFERQNLVLIGMPGCGKSTVGRLLASRLGRPLQNTDALLAERTGVPVPALLRARGEAAFRELEAELVRELALSGGQVIATGGGTVLRQDSLAALRQNGLLLFLDRPLSALRPSADRPLSDTEEKLKALYSARLPLYRAAADRTVPVTGAPEDTVSDILRLIFPDDF